MPSITFDLETVTPLFLAGADQSTAELRPPAFRGALRYWFRAIAGSYYWDRLDELRKIESSLLGDTQEGASNIIIRIKNFPENLRPDIFTLRQGSGLGYLWFSTKAQKRENKPPRKAIGIEDPVRFSVVISTRTNPQRIRQQQRNLILAANAFWLAVNLGGFGSRERRGAGSLRVLQVHHLGLDENFSRALPRFDIRFRTDQLPVYFRNEISKIEGRFNRFLNQQDLDLSELNLLNFEIFKPTNRLTKIYRIQEPYSSWEDALDDIGQQYSEYRRTISLRERMVFGLPLKANSTRHPSPLRIKIVQSVREYFCFLITTYSAFPESMSITLDDFSVINEFIRNCPNIEEVV